jgi:DNA (cytosine-5)-methyltransferase 1
MAVSLNTLALIIENVPSIVNDKTRVVDAAKILLRNNGYYVTDGIIDSQYLGCAQTRKRHFLIASKTPLDPIDYLVKVFMKPVVSLRWAIGDLLEEDGKSHFDTAPQLSAANRKRIEFMFNNDLFNLPDDERPECHKNGHTYPSVYGRLDWDRPSGTITTGFLTPGRGRFIHPLRKRVLTPHEAARIQGFPDSFMFVPPKKNSSPRNLLTKSIGGAVPPVMGYVTGSCALASLSEKLHERK